MCLLVQGVKQYKHQCVQEDLLCQGPGHLLPNQYFQISTKYKEHDTHEMVICINPHHFTRNSKKCNSTFPIKVLKRRIPWVSTPASLSEFSNQLKYKNSALVIDKSLRKAQKVQLTIQITLNLRNTRSCRCWCKIGDYKCRRED